VIVQCSGSPIAPQKAADKACNNCNHVGFSKQARIHIILQWMNTDCRLLDLNTVYLGLIKGSSRAYTDINDKYDC